jgi:ribonuclease P protein component
MNNSESLKNNEDFREIYRTAKSYANKYLIMYVKKNNYSYNRLGISVSKKVGNSVVRHRITRLIRESYRLSEDSILSGLDNTAKLREVEERLVRIIDPELDSLRFYNLGNGYDTKIKHIGAKSSFDVKEPIVL